MGRTPESETAFLKDSLKSSIAGFCLNCLTLTRKAQNMFIASVRPSVRPSVKPKFGRSKTKFDDADDAMWGVREAAPKN